MAYVFSYVVLFCPFIFVDAAPPYKVAGWEGAGRNAHAVLLSPMISSDVEAHNHRYAYLHIPEFLCTNGYYRLCIEPRCCNPTASACHSRANSVTCYETDSTANGVVFEDDCDHNDLL